MNDIPTRSQADHLLPLSSSFRVALTLGALGSFAALAFSVYFFKDSGASQFMLSMMLASFVGGGKLVILAGAVDGAPLNAWELALLVVAADVASATIMIAHMQSLFSLPRVGERLAKIRRSGAAMLERRAWLKRSSFFGLMLLVAAPLQGTGSITGVLLGRIVGLSRASIVVASFVGSFIGALIMALIAESAAAEITAIAHNPYLKALSLSLLFGLTFALGKWLSGTSTDDEKSAALEKDDA